MSTEPSSPDAPRPDTPLHDARPVRDRFGFRFVTLARAWRRAVEQKLAEAGLTDATWTPLIHLAESGDGISQVDLARRVGLDASTLVRLIDILEGRGLVERAPDPRDRRARRLLLTAAGRAEVARIRARVGELEEVLLADLDDAALERMCDDMERIETRLSAFLAAPGSASSATD